MLRYRPHVINVRKSCLMNKIEEFLRRIKFLLLSRYLRDKLKYSNIPRGFLIDVKDCHFLCYLIDFVGVPTISALLIIYPNLKCTPWCSYVVKCVISSYTLNIFSDKTESISSLVNALATLKDLKNDGLD